MTEGSLLTQLIDAIVNMDLDSAKKLSEEALQKGIKPPEIIQKGIMKAVNIIGEKFELEEYFLPELVMGGEIIQQIMVILEPTIKNSNELKDYGKIIIGTGKGDMHDIGKNIVIIFLKAEGFTVIDLGVDVSAAKFIESIRREHPKILAISALISSTMLEVQKTMEALKASNLRNEVKVIVGGAPITQEFVDDIGADAYARNVINGVKICKRWVES